MSKTLFEKNLKSRKQLKNINMGKNRVAYQYKFKSKRNVSADFVAKQARYLHKQLKKQGVKGKVLVNLKYKKPYGWLAGQSFKIGSRAVYKRKALYMFKDENMDHVKEYAFQVFIHVPAGGCSGKWNNCFHDCMKEVFGGVENMPKEMQDPFKMKNKFKIPSKAKVNVSMIDKLAKKFNMRIDVVGDEVHQSQHKFGKYCRLKLSDGHYTVEKHRQLPFSYTMLNHKNEIVFTFLNANLEVELYNEKSELTNTFPNTELAYQFCKKQKLKRFWIAPNKNVKDIITEWTKAKQELKQACSWIDLRKTKTAKITALYVWHYLTKNIPQPDIIDQIEGKFLKHAMLGGLMYAEKGTHTNCTQYDKNSFYPSIMQMKTFYIPYTRGKFYTLNKLPDKPTDIKYGIYRAEIEGAEDNKLFRMSIEDYYTHFDIISAKKLGLTVTLIQDNQPNAMIYDKLISGYSLFYKYVQMFYTMKENKVKWAKLLLNIIWGALCQKNTTKQFTYHNTEAVVKDQDVLECLPYGDGYRLVLQDNPKPYKTDWARLGAFLTARGRAHMRYLLNDHKDKIVYIHTDGFVVKDIKLKINNQLGGLKEEASGTVIIKSVNQKKVWV